SASEVLPRLQSLEEAEQMLAQGADSFLGSIVVGSIENGGQRVLRLGCDDLFAAVMRNRQRGRFFRAVLAYFVGISGGWDQQAFRGFGVDFAPGGGGGNDDWADLSLFLYAQDGDVILSADRRVGAIARIIDPQGVVRVCVAAACGGAA